MSEMGYIHWNGLFLGSLKEFTAQMVSRDFKKVIL